MADQDRATAPDPGVAAFQALAETAMVNAARTVHDHHQRRWAAVVVPLASAARDVVHNAATVQGLADIPEGLSAAVCRLEIAAAGIDMPAPGPTAADWEQAVGDIRGNYPEQVFSPDGTSPDAVGGQIARGICDAIARRAAELARDTSNLAASLEPAAAETSVVPPVRRPPKPAS